MLFNSYLFIFIFLPLVIMGFYGLAKINKKGALFFLLIASFVFYGWWQPTYLILLICSIMVNYHIGITLNKKKQARCWLVVGIVFNIALLGYYKYAHFLVDNINHLAHSTYHLDNILLPLAISFFTFQQIAFLVDTYRGQIQDFSFLKYCLFICFFPQLIAGPIVHHQNVIPQFASKRLFNYNSKNFALGCTLFIMGLFKKVIIADHLALYATPVFDALGSGYILTLWEAWGGALAYSFQLYFDFSGYSDMALGIGWMLNIRLPQNFNSPYQAKNIIDFWRRWHITLSHFLRDYLYIPLGGNRKGVSRRYGNLLLTMLIGGLWHGAGWTFLIWGALHGGYLIINHTWRTWTHALDKPRYYPWVAQALTFISIVLAWVFFRASRVSDAVSMLKSMFGGNGIHLPHVLKQNVSLGQSPFIFEGLFSNALCHWPQGLFWIMIALLVALFCPNSYQLLRQYQVADYSNHSVLTLTWSPNRVWRWAMMVLGVLAVLHLGQMSEFLYFQF